MVSQTSGLTILSSHSEVARKAAISERVSSNPGQFNEMAIMSMHSEFKQRKLYNFLGFLARLFLTRMHLEKKEGFFKPYMKIL